ncbi:MAG: diguanylate cyclase [Glaciimonas sp.]|nr:diguanylate cyclase [Glaciimonas sp.]
MTVNEALGRTAGDQVLNAFVLRTRQTLHPRDMLARLSGEDFVAVSEVTQATDAGPYCHQSDCVVGLIACAFT